MIRNAPEPPEPEFHSLVLLLREPLLPDEEAIKLAAAKARSALMLGGHQGILDVVRMPIPEANEPWPEEVRVFHLVLPDAHLAPVPLRIGVMESPFPYSIPEDCPDLLICHILEEHAGWVSCDLILPEPSELPQELSHRFYVFAVRLLSALVPRAQVVGAYLPYYRRLFQATRDFWKAVDSDAPLENLLRLEQLPVTDVEEDDDEMNRAMELARQRFPEFLAAFRSGKGEAYLVKARFEHQGNVDHIWVAVESIEGTKIIGTLDHDPAFLENLSMGDRVVIETSDLNTIRDWLYIDKKGNIVGGFTIPILLARLVEG